METSKLFLEAIARRKCVAATYNRTRVEIAPHILYTRHGDLFVDATTIQRDGQPPRERKLGTFKVAGLAEPALAERDFAPDSVFDPANPKYDGVTLFAV